MSHPITVRFRVDASETLGLGHLSRCRSLILAFKMIEPRCRFDIVTKNIEVAQKFLAGIDADIYTLGLSDKTRYVDLTIVDVPEISARKDEDPAAWRGLLICIDDDGAGLEHQDVLIRPNLLDLPLPAGIEETCYWSGRDYIMLHPEFASLPMRHRDEKIRELLVCFGGSDPAGVTLRVIPLIKFLCGNIKVNIVLGAAFTRREEVLREIGKDDRFFVCFNAVRMAEHFSRADAAFISGGTLLYEACATGVPAVVISQNKAQAVEAGICHRSGAAMALGIHNELTDDAITVSVVRFLSDAGLRKRMSRDAMNIVAPDGSGRIASKLLTRVKRDAKR